MVKTKEKEVKKLHKMLSTDGYRLPHGYELRRCKSSHCGWAIVGHGTTVAPMRTRKKSKKGK